VSGPLVPRRLPYLDGRSPKPVTDWVVDSGITNHTTPHPGHIFSPRRLSLGHSSSIVIGNGFVLPVT
jgi:hypothetical protein